MYRIKTEQEFISEYGTKWKMKVGWNLGSSMDHLFGKEVETNQHHHINEWSISPDMITDKPLKKTMLVKIKDREYLNDVLYGWTDEMEIRIPGDRIIEIWGSGRPYHWDFPDITFSISKAMIERWEDSKSAPEYSGKDIDTIMYGATRSDPPEPSPYPFLYPQYGMRFSADFHVRPDKKSKIKKRTYNLNY